MLVFLLVLGHACELPALAELVSDATEDTHHFHFNVDLFAEDSSTEPARTATPTPDLARSTRPTANSTVDGGSD